jgi:putative ABC transport system permease protein
MSAVASRLPGRLAAPVPGIEAPGAPARSPRTLPIEAACIAVDSIAAHKLRSVLTLVGIIIGVASVVTVGGAIEGLGAYVTDRLTSSFGSNTFLVAQIARMHLSGDEWERLMRRNRRIDVDDLRSIEQRCGECEAVAPSLRSRDEAKAGNSTFYDADVTGVGAGITRIQAIDLAEGRFLSTFEVEHARPVAVIGADIRRELFGPVDPLGKEIKVGGDPLTVVGVERSNGTFFGQSMDRSVYLPYTTFLKKYGSRQSITVRVKAPSAESLDRVQDEVRVILRAKRKLRPNQEDTFDILASRSMQESVGRFTGAIAVVVTPITLISLLVGGIVVMNIMLVTVTERTREIGMRKAVGARRRDILMQFLIESALLATAGGTLGILLAHGLAWLIRATTPIPMTITPGYILLSLTASCGIGLLFGIYPAHKASKLDPIVALSRD